MDDNDDDNVPKHRGLQLWQDQENTLADRHIAMSLHDDDGDDYNNDDADDDSDKELTISIHVKVTATGFIGTTEAFRRTITMMMMMMIMMMMMMSTSQR